MIARTLPFKPRDKPKPPELPSTPLEEMEHQQTPADQLKQAQEQIELTRTYPGRK